MRQIIVSPLTEKFGLIDYNGEKLIPTLYDEIIIHPITDLTEVRIGNKKGVADAWGKIVIPVKYDDIVILGDFYNVIGVKTGSKWQLVDRRCNLVSELLFDDLHFYFDSNVIGVQQNGKWQLVCCNGIPIMQDKFDEIAPHSYRLFGVKKNGKWGVITNNGKQIVDFIYDDVIAGNDDFIQLKTNDKWGAIDRHGIEIIPFEFEKIDEGISEKESHIIESEIVKFESEADYQLMDNEFIDSSSNTFLCQKASGEEKQYLYNKLKFEIVESNEKFGIIDSNGNVIIPLKYDLIHFYEYNDLILANLDGKWGYIDWQDNIVIPFQYRYAEMFWESDNTGVAIDERKWGIINKQGETLLPFVYDEIIIPFENGMARICKNGRVYEIDINGKEI